MASMLSSHVLATVPKGMRWMPAGRSTFVLECCCLLSLAGGGGNLHNSTSESGLLHMSGHGTPPRKRAMQVGIPQAAKPMFRRVPGCHTGIVAHQGLQVLRQIECAQALTPWAHAARPALCGSECPACTLLTTGAHFK